MNAKQIIAAIIVCIVTVTYIHQILDKDPSTHGIAKALFLGLVMSLVSGIILSFMDDEENF